MTSISEVNSEWVAFKHRSETHHGFQITSLPDYLSMCLLKAFVILNSSFNYGLSKLVMYSLTTDPETSWVNYSYIIQMPNSWRSSQYSIHLPRSQYSTICKKLKILHIIIILFLRALNFNYCGYKLLLQTQVLIKLSLLLGCQWIEK